MKCPHCLVEFHDSWSRHDIGADADYFWRVAWTLCPACSRLVIRLNAAHKGNTGNILKGYFAHPKGVSRSPLSPAVPERFAADYREACLVAADSPKASAALGRRVLQNLLREVAKVKPQELANEIEEVLKSGVLPPYLANDIDAVRQIGNFAAHPMKSKSSGEVADVEPGEAEWTLDVLEALFDFYFVQPANQSAKRDALNKKLTDLGKPPLKSSLP